MEFSDFKTSLKEKLEKININVNDTQVKKFYDYMNLLIKWNEKINLTAITEPEEIILKHFVDSLTIAKKIKTEDTIVDVGTGAGFPGIPLKIINPENKVVLIDSLNKRIKFLEEVIDKCDLKGIDVVHARAEDIGKDKNYREQFDVAASRAVASLDVLLEYMLPFVKVGGYAICMKGPNYKEELEIGRKAIDVLGGEYQFIETLNIDEELERNIIVIKKVKETPKKYPRKQGKPLKEPIR